MEMVLEIACLSHGVVCGYGNPHTLTPAGIKLKTGTCQGDAATLRPTMMVFAPAILDKVQVALHAKISSSSPIVQTLFKWGLAAGEANFFKGVVGAPWYYNKIVFKKVQALLGGRVVFAATGSAPLAPQTQRFVQTAFNAPTRQGYGLTETCATSCIQVTRHRALRLWARALEMMGTGGAGCRAAACLLHPASAVRLVHVSSRLGALAALQPPQLRLPAAGGLRQLVWRGGPADLLVRHQAPRLGRRHLPQLR
jgi:acyl-CoA synthetase (AMP-forming)/AMP-acid ligase II